MAPAPLREGDPSRIGRYRLSARLGAGGMGVVYLGTARDGTLAAIKVLRAELADDAEFRARFRREVAALDRVSGICTVRVIEADTESDQPFLTTEYAAGPTLAEHVGDFGPLAPPMLLGLATGLAEALTAIHAAGIVHRDLKPGNVLLASGGPKVIDFGIAQALDFTSVTRAGLSIGSPGFMAPEQIRGQAGPAADVFSWALTVAYAASGQPPFGTGPAETIFFRVLHDDPDVSAVPDQLRPLIEEALAKTPGDRPSAPDLLRRLAAASGEPDAGASTAARRVLARTWISPAAGQRLAVTRARRRRRPARVPLAAVMLGLAVIGAALTIAGARGPAQAPRAGVVATVTPSANATTTWADPGTWPPSPDYAVSVAPGTTGPIPEGTCQAGCGGVPLPLASGSDGAAAAVGYLVGTGVTPVRGGLPWKRSARLNVILGRVGPVFADGDRAYFFANGAFVGNDVDDSSVGVRAVRVSSIEIDLVYRLYDGSAPAAGCCLTGKTTRVRFQLTGMTVTALDPIPPSSFRT